MSTSAREPYMSVQDVAEYLAVSPETILRLIRDGDLPAVRVGKRQWRIGVGALADYLTRQRKEKPA